MGELKENSKYHVFILVAGKSSRLAHHTRDKPKSLIDVGGKAIINYNLDMLIKHNISKITFIVGYLKEKIMSHIGDNYKGIPVEYIESKDYYKTEHGWSLYLTRDSWMKDKNNFLLLDADAIYHPEIIDKTIKSNYDNVICVDKNIFKDNIEEWVIGENNLVTGFERGLSKEINNVVGEFLGVNKLSSNFMEKLYEFMDDFFKKNGLKYKYERIFDSFIKTNKVNLNYIFSEQFPWVNINNEQSLEKARKIALFEL